MPIDRLRSNVPPLAWLPWLTLLIGLGITYAVWHETRSDSGQVAQEKFEFRVAEISRDIEGRMRAYEQVLLGTVGLFAASESVTRSEFKANVDVLRLAEHFPGIQGVGFSRLVAARERQRHIEQIRREGFPEYDLHPGDARDFHTAIVYIEPFDWRNRRAFGYDMYSDPVRRVAMQRAWEEGVSAISGKVTLRQETEADIQAGFLMYMPVYRNQLAHASPAQRRGNLLGWVYAPFRMNDLMRNILQKNFGEKTAALDLEIFDGSDPSAANMLYDSDKISRLAQVPSGGHLAKRQIRIGGRVWTVLVHAARAPEAPKLLAIAGIGSIGSLMLAAILWLLLHGRARALKLAAEMNRELLARERYQQELLAHLPAAVVVHGADGAIRYTNEEANRLLGLNPGEGDAVFAWHLRHEDGRAMAPADFPVQRVLTSQAPLRGVMLGIARDEAAAPLWLQVNAFPHLDAAGNLSEVVVSFLDITSLRTAKEALQRALAELDDIYHHAPCGYHSLDGDGRFARINQTELDWLGYRREDIIGKRFADLLTPASLTVFQDNYPRFKANGEVHDLEYELIRQDASTFTVLLSATAAYDDAGRYLMSRSTLYDISERKQAESELTRLNHLYALLNRANQAIVRIREIDPLLEEICRVAVEEGGFVMAWAGRVVAGRVIPYAHWGHEEGYLDQVRILVADRALGGGPTGTAIREGRHYLCDDIANDPHMAPWRELALARGYRASAAFPVRIGGEVVGAINLYAPTAGYFSAAVVDLLNDLTEDVSFAMNAHDEAKRRQKAEDDLRQLNEQLEQRVLQRTRELEAANKELESFSYSVSHDLRAPLRSIDGFSQVLLQRYAATLDDTGRDYLGRVRRASQRMGELIDDLLQLSRMTRGPLRRQEVDLSALAVALLQDLQRTTPERQVQLRVQPDLRVFGDPGLLRVVLDNLLGNAWKFTRHRENAEIEFGSRVQENELVYFVRDNGAGFDNAYAKKLFQVFQRLHSERDFEGTGIGLATVQRVILRHHGRVGATGEKGNGATFWFTLPQRDPARDDEISDIMDEQGQTF